jgi:proline iminopeptidase
MSAPDADLRFNTTWHLVADIELLRRNLGIETWQVFGGSWGSALALAYAQCHPDAVSEIVLRGVFTLRRHELEWFYEGRRGDLPRPVGELSGTDPRAGALAADRGVPSPLTDPDPAVHEPAAIAWTTWEMSTLTLHPDPDLVASMTDAATAVAFARIENHYFMHGGWLREGQLIDDVGAIRGIPAVIVQGRYDICTPIMTAWDLHRAWPEAEFVVVDDAGHAASEPASPAPCAPRPTASPPDARRARASRGGLEALARGMPPARSRRRTLPSPPGSDRMIG